MNLITYENVTRSYKINGDIETYALRGISLTIEEGEFVCVAGPSGSGKTTTLNIAGMLDLPTDGKVCIAGIDPGVMKEKEKARFRLANLGFVFQAYNLIPVLSGYENAEMLLVLQKTPAAERKKRILPLLDLLGVADIADKRPAQMSGGQQQRFAVARAIASHPKVVLADEPTANLDSTTSEALIHLMKEMNREEGITFLFSSHDELVHRHADRLVSLKDGRVQQDKRQNVACDASAGDT